MITAHVIEAYVDNLGKIAEKDLGWTLVPEAPIEKRPVPAAKPGEPPPPVTAVKVNGADYLIIGFSWDIKTAQTLVENLPESCLILIVQRIAPPSPIVKADAGVLKQLDSLSGKKN